jgi:uncharacterized membrane protein
MRRWLRWFFILATLPWPLSLSAQNATITGQIKDSKGKPVEKSTVMIGDRFDFTDADGYYRIKNVPSGQQVLTIKKGLKTETMRIQVNLPKITQDASISDR